MNFFYNSGTIVDKIWAIATAERSASAKLFPLAPTSNNKE
jgi:hypothetical protein